MKLINSTSGQFIDDINKLIEPVVSMAKHPREDWALYGGSEGGVRLYKIKENQERTSANNDVNLVREFERQQGIVHSCQFSPDGTLAAIGNSSGEVRLFQTSDGKKTKTLSSAQGAVFAVAFDATGKRLFTGGFDGLIRVYDPVEGSLLAVFNPVPATAWIGPLAVNVTPSK